MFLFHSSGPQGFNRIRAFRFWDRINRTYRMNHGRGQQVSFPPPILFLLFILSRTLPVLALLRKDSACHPVPPLHPVKGLCLILAFLCLLPARVVKW